MALSKKQFEIIFERLLFVYLVVFPLGQLLRVVVPIAGLSARVHVADMIVLAASILWLFSKTKYPTIAKYVFDFVMVALFSLVFSAALFPIASVVVGSLYLVRIVSYLLFFVGAYQYIKAKSSRRQLIFKSLLGVGLTVAIIGWIQYFYLPDLRFLKYLNWDDHLFRLAGTFLDPGFTGIILVFASLISLGAFINKKRRLYVLLFIFFVLSIGFTYSRASYLALVAGFVPLVLKRNIIKQAAAFLLVFLALLIALPRPGGEGVRLERVSSVTARLENYSETMEIFKRHPVLGVGFNNLCTARIMYIEGSLFESHACSGTDSSLLLVAATTGIVGLMVFVYMSVRLFSFVDSGLYGTVFKSTSAALFVHSLFVNSAFYPWVMGWMAFLLAISVKSYKE